MKSIALRILAFLSIPFIIIGYTAYFIHVFTMSGYKIAEEAFGRLFEGVVKNDGE